METKSTIFSLSEGFVVFTFFVLPCFTPVSTNRLNSISTDILFGVTSSMMLTTVANSYYSSYDFDRII